MTKDVRDGSLRGVYSPGKYSVLVFLALLALVTLIQGLTLEGLSQALQMAGVGLCRSFSQLTASSSPAVIDPHESSG